MLGVKIPVSGVVLHIDSDGLSTTTVNNDLHLPFEIQSTSTLYSLQSIADYNWEALSGNGKKKRCEYK